MSKDVMFFDSPASSESKGKAMFEADAHLDTAGGGTCPLQLCNIAGGVAGSLATMLDTIKEAFSAAK
jgi:hypothetical protein